MFHILVTLFLIIFLNYFISLLFFPFYLVSNYLVY